jgi:uncharacterized membrane protein (DUF4010 family)
MDTAELFQRLGLALAIGLLVGLERGWREREATAGSRTAGIRTFALIGLLGGLWAAMSPILGPAPLAAAGLAFAAAFTLFQWREVSAKGEFSVTGTIAGFVVFALGALAVLGNQTVAAGVGVVTVGLLAARGPLHEFLKRLTWPELRSVTLLLVMTFVALPILPDRPLDPWGAFNPHELWLLTVLIAVISFAGYVAVRALGEESGLLLSSVAGAVVSSTTVTLNNARLARQEGPKKYAILSLAISIAWLTSIVRMTIIAVGINAQLLRPLAGPVLTAALILGIAALYFQIRSGQEKDSAPSSFQNPLDLKFVLGLGALISVVVVVAKIASDTYGQSGLLVLAGVSGIADVDPVTLSAARLAGVSITPENAAQAILLAAAINMMTKMAATFIAGWRFAVPIVAAGVLAIVAGAAAMLLLGA